MGQATTLPISLGTSQVLALGSVSVAAREAAAIVAVQQAGPAFVLLASDEVLGRIPLCIECVKLLIQTFLNALAGVGRVANGFRIWSFRFFGTCLFALLVLGREMTTVLVFAGDLFGHGGERAVDLVVLFRALSQNFDLQRLSAITADQQCARWWQACVVVCRRRVGSWFLGGG